jgi:hypothetical protein
VILLVAIRQLQTDQEKTREELVDSLNTWTSSKVDFVLGLSFCMRQNKTSTDSHQKDGGDQLLYISKFVVFLGSALPLYTAMFVCPSVQIRQKKARL